MAAPEAKKAKQLVERATCTAPVNIAVIKYWGKRDTKLLLPINDSLSGTLSQDELHARTTVATSETFTNDEIYLNGKQEDIHNPRLQNVLRAIRAKAEAQNPDDARLKQGIKICSVNNFPTAAGLASSAAGYACLVAALAKLFALPLEGLTDVARVGSGSACRSLMGGFVRWTKGEQADGVDSVASQVVPESHWPEMEVLILVVNAGKKSVSSTSGMQTTCQTSDLIDHRANVVVPARMKAIEQAIQDKDFKTFAEITMKDSNQFHATCLDTYPPIFYMNDTSKAIVHCLTRFNAMKETPRAAYTYDAGPNCVIYALKQDIADILALVGHYFPAEDGVQEFVRGRSTSLPSSPLAADMQGWMASQQGGVKYILHTGIGDGPRAVEDEKLQLIDSQGQPRL
eukprot:TRINITY_DN5446_c0_g1_i2.p1 TRINITY_DN5446_c0_g1~~TRINITY_DN5446_c0_g1_i2.p1  ORF type:complete len:400 (+),score=107.88 TRINITY_DN5446_c0_g1_i2:64-1263(+)